MITDAQLRFSDAQSLVGAAATTVATNNIDLLSANRNVGRGYPKRILVLAGIAFTGGTSVQVQVIQSANSNMSSPDVLATATAVADASATAGAELADMPIPDVTKRYLGLQYVTLGTHTTGTIGFAGIVETTDEVNNKVAAVTGF